VVVAGGVATRGVVGPTPWPWLDVPGSPA